MQGLEISLQTLYISEKNVYEDLAVFLLSKGDILLDFFCPAPNLIPGIKSVLSKCFHFKLCNEQVKFTKGVGIRTWKMT